MASKNNKKKKNEAAKTGPTGFATDRRKISKLSRVMALLLGRDSLPAKTILCFALYPDCIKKGSVGHRPTEASDHSPFSYDFFR